jgi:hypothetical protein
MVLRLGLRLLFRSKNIYEFFSKIDIATVVAESIRGGICSQPLQNTPLPGAASFQSQDKPAPSRKLNNVCRVN